MSESSFVDLVSFVASISDCFIFSVLVKGYIFIHTALMEILKNYLIASSPPQKVTAKRIKLEDNSKIEKKRGSSVLNIYNKKIKKIISPPPPTSRTLQPS